LQQIDSGAAANRTGVSLRVRQDVGVHPALRVIARRLLLAIPLLFVVSFLIFALLSAVPGSAAHQILGAKATPEEVQRVSKSLGLDQPLYEQYWHWLQNAFDGDLGASLITAEPVTQAISERAPVSLSLVSGALLVSVIFGVGLGIVSAVRGGVLGRLIDAVSMVGWVLPAYWIGAELIAIFAVELNLLPATGYIPLTESFSGWLRSLVLPVCALALGGIGLLARQTREAMLDALASEHIRIARASGIAPRSIYFRHALRNAAPRILTVFGLLTVGLLGGTVFAETVFAMPGLGSLMVNGVQGHDLPVVVGVAVTFTIVVVAINLIVDLAYTWIDPRVRTQ
jgi:peptide/nickel transport system permease protein